MLLNILSFNVLEEKSRVKDCIEVSFTQIEICYMKDDGFLSRFV